MALWVSLAVGTLFAFGQEARGAHFLSHDVCSAFVAWFVALATYSAWVQRPTPPWLFGPMNYQFDPATGRHDPEGLLSALGALATTRLGVRAGDSRSGLLTRSGVLTKL